MESGKAYYRNNMWVIVPDKNINLEHIAILNDGLIDGVPIQFEFTDPRKVHPKQRTLFFALLNDIHEWSGMPKEKLKEYFYKRYSKRTSGKEISLADNTENTVSDANKLIKDVINFIFEFDVPVRNGYKLLPRNESYFIYKCLLKDKCVICGKKADFHHVEGSVVGMGNNRNKIDHSKRELYPLCRFHHQEIERLNNKRFETKYHIHVKGLKLPPEILKKLGVKGKYGD